MRAFFVEVRLLKYANGYKQLRRLNPVAPHSRDSSGLQRAQGEGNTVGQKASGEEAHRGSAGTDNFRRARSEDHYGKNDCS